MSRSCCSNRSIEQLVAVLMLPNFLRRRFAGLDRSFSAAEIRHPNYRCLIGKWADMALTSGSEDNEMVAGSWLRVCIGIVTGTSLTFELTCSTLPPLNMIVGLTITSNLHMPVMKVRQP